MAYNWMTNTYSEDNPVVPTTSAYDALTKQILGQGTTSKWSGEGFGSAEANAADMAKILSGIGITDIKQFGEVPKYQQLQSGGYKLGNDAVYQGEDGTWLQRTPTGLYTDEGYPDYQTKTVSEAQVKDIKPVYGQFTEDENGRVFVPVNPSEVTMVNGVPSIKTGTTYGNKVTGQAAPSTYGERQTGNAWGGTFAGSGNTGYRVQFDAQGNPYFYTTGASSNDLANLLGDSPILNFAANVGAAAFGGPLGTAALQLAQGNDLGDAAKAALLTYGGQQVSGLFGDGGVSAAADADMAGGMVPEYGTNAAYDAAMQSAMTPEATAAIEAGIAGPTGPMTQAELGQGFEDYMKAAGYTPDTMGPATAEQLGTSFQDDMAKAGYTSAPAEGLSIPKSVQDAILKYLPGLFAGGAAAGLANQATQSYTPKPAYKPQESIPTYSPDYFNQVQNYYTGYMPNMSRDVATPLQDWYNTGYTGEDSVTKKLFGV